MISDHNRGISNWTTGVRTVVITSHSSVGTYPAKQQNRSRTQVENPVGRVLNIFDKFCVKKVAKNSSERTPFKFYYT